MTKEQHLERRILTFPSDGDMTDEAIKRNVLAAMDAYARQEAVEYCRWTKIVAYYFPAKERWYFFPNEPLYNKEGHTDDEMYNLYQQQKQK